MAGEVRTVTEFFTTFGAAMTFFANMHRSKMNIQIGCLVEHFSTLGFRTAMSLFTCVRSGVTI